MRDDRITEENNRTNLKRKVRENDNSWVPSTNKKKLKLNRTP